MKGKGNDMERLRRGGFTLLELIIVVALRDVCAPVVPTRKPTPPLEPPSGALIGLIRIEIHRAEHTRGRLLH